jgi:hypothetical protein
MSKKSEQKSGGKNLKVMHTAVGSWPKGHVIGADELPDGTDVNRLLALGAVVETDDPATGGLDASALPPGAAVSHQLSPGDELPPNALETAKAGAGSASGVESADELHDLTVPDLKAKADGLGIESTSGMNKNELVKAIRKAEKDAAK